MCISPEKKSRIKISFVLNLHLTPTYRLRKIIIIRIYLGVEINKIKAGASFCQVKKTKVVTSESFGIRAAPQKCNGARLVFRINPIMIITVTKET